MLRNSLSLDDLSGLVAPIAGVSDVEIHDNSVWFSYMDKDNQLVLVAVNELSQERLLAGMPILVPPTKMMGSLLASNSWNERPDAHSTFAYVTLLDEERPCVMLESHLIITGGVEEKNISAWLNNFIHHINLFESCVIPAVDSTIDDEYILRQEAGGLWFKLGQFGGSFLKGILQPWIGTRGL
jgi:hypothetical protein